MKIFDKKVKMPKEAIWLVPGLKVKRWFALSVAGSVLAALGATFLFQLEPLDYIVAMAKKLFYVVPPEPVGALLILTGVVLFFLAWKKTNISMMNDDIDSQRIKGSMGEVLYRRMKLDRGPKIVAIGGGTGLSMLLRGIKKITNNITAIVTVGDDGGSSGRLREQMGVLPPGDIRNCIAALADDDDIVTKLFQYRFKTGEGLEGHSFGNLFITAMSAICGDIVSAIRESSKVLLIRGRVLPATCDDMKLYAKMEDDSIVKGESNIPEAGKKIIQLCCEPADCKPAPDVLEAIHNADIIIMGPGSLYTSIISNFLVKDITRAVWNAKAKKIYVCNAMTQPGETDNTEIVIIKLCVRLEAILRCDYHYEGEFSEMLNEYCSKHGREDDGWGYDVEADFVKYLHKLRKCRNNIVHSERTEEEMTIDEIKFCIEYICRMG